MAKRFTDSSKWTKHWFAVLTPEYKLFWIYLLDQCDNAGIYDKYLELAEFSIGLKLNEQDILEKFGKHIVQISHKKWFLPKFIEFQYGDLNPANKAHLSVIKKLQKYNLDQYIKGHTSPLHEPKEQNKNRNRTKSKPSNLDEVKEYLKEKNIKDVDAIKFYSFYEANGWVQGKNKPIKNWKMCVNTWRGKEEDQSKTQEIKIGCPKHPKIIRMAAKDTWAFCPECREKLIDVESMDYINYTNTT
jgi:hypothetical protein